MDKLILVIVAIVIIFFGGYALTKSISTSLKNSTLVQTVESANEADKNTYKNCPTDYNPVCGVNGLTYTNICYATLMNKIAVQYLGVCKNTNTYGPQLPQNPYNYNPYSDGTYPLYNYSHQYVENSIPVDKQNCNSRLPGGRWFDYTKTCEAEIGDTYLTDQICVSAGGYVDRSGRNLCRRHQSEGNLNVCAMYMANVCILR